MPADSDETASSEIRPGFAEESRQAGRDDESRELHAILCRLGHWTNKVLDLGRLQMVVREAVEKHPGLDGRSRMGRLAHGAAEMGFRARPIPGRLSELVRMAGPDSPLAFYSGGPSGGIWRLVVRRGWFGAKMEDPLSGRIESISTGSLDRLAGTDPEVLLVEDGHAVAVMAGGGPQDPGDSDHDAAEGDHSSPSPFQRVKAFMRLERRDLVTLVWYAIATSLLYLAIPLSVDALVSNIAFGGQQQAYVQALATLAVVLGVFLSVYAAMRALAFVVIERLQRRMFVRFTADFALRLPRVRQSEFDRQHGPELMNRFFDVMTMQKAAALLLLDGLDVVLGFLASAVVLAFYDWTLFWFDAGLILMVLIVVCGLGRQGVATSILESKAKYRTAGWLQQVALFSDVFKGPGGGEMSAGRTDDLARSYLKYRQKHFVILFRQVIGLLAIEVLAAVALLGWGGVLVLNGQLSIGQLVASELILATALASVAKFGKQLETAYDLLTAIDKLGHVVDLQMERSDGDVPRNVSSRGAAVAVHQLNFSFRHGHPVLENVNMSVPSGARVALVAPSGSGASTLMDLMHGHREPGGGHIDIDGQDLRNWKLSALRSQVALVRGDDEIFEGSVFDNIRLGNETVGRAETREALAGVGFLPEVLAMPQGMDEPLQILGRSLSGTERRQLLLARAIVLQPRLLLIDSVLDGFASERREGILQYLFDPERPWTLIIATHDPDIIRRCQQTLTMPARRSQETARSSHHAN